MLWDHEAGGSNPLTPTIPLHISPEYSNHPLYVHAWIDLTQFMNAVIILNQIQHCGLFIEI
jgi:hypothetical protein